MNRCDWDHAFGTVFQIQRWSINDGEGIRSTVFLKGCPLRCKWCANPESWRHDPEVLVLHDRCVHCGRCAQVCDAGAIVVEPGKPHVFLREKCRACAKCCGVCPVGARKKIGSIMSVAEVMSVVNKDAVFYRESGGGVTFSGGEPFAQAEFLRQTIAACTRLGINTTVETSGCFEWDQVKDIFEQLDCVFIDIKHMNDTIHRLFTGVGNQRILNNIIAISQIHPNVIIRVPLIKEVNASEKNIRQMCEFLQRNASVKGVELLSYHNYGEAKYAAIGGGFHAFTAPDATEIEALKSLISSYGIRNLDFK